MLRLTKSSRYKEVKVQFRLLIALCFLVDKTLCQSYYGYDHEENAWNRGNEERRTAGERTAAWTQSDGVNVEELGDEFQGDMIVDKPSDLESPKPWPGKRIPYVINGQFTPSELNTIGGAMDDIHASTCLRFVPRTDERYYLTITSIPKGCASHIGYSTNYPTMNLQSPNCLKKKGTIIHELMHAAGITHEQSRHNRDNYVRVLWENIKPSQMNDFATFRNDNYEGPYTFTSLMHYSNYAFSKNKKRTIVPNWRGFENAQTGQRDNMTSADSDKINALYRCPPEYFSKNYPPHLLGNPPPMPLISYHPTKMVTITDTDTGRIVKKVKVQVLTMEEWAAMYYPRYVVSPAAPNSISTDGKYDTVKPLEPGYFISPLPSSIGTTKSEDPYARYYPSNAIQSETANSVHANDYLLNTDQSEYVYSGTPNAGYSSLNTGRSGNPYYRSAPQYNHGPIYYVQSKK